MHNITGNTSSLFIESVHDIQNQKTMLEERAIPIKAKIKVLKGNNLTLEKEKREGKRRNYSATQSQISQNKNEIKSLEIQLRKIDSKLLDIEDNQEPTSFLGQAILGITSVALLPVTIISNLANKYPAVAIGTVLLSSLFYATASPIAAAITAANDLQNSTTPSTGNSTTPSSRNSTTPLSGNSTTPSSGNSTTPSLNTTPLVQNTTTQQTIMPSTSELCDGVSTDVALGAAALSFAAGVVSFVGFQLCCSELKKPKIIFETSALLKESKNREEEEELPQMHF